MKSLSSRNKNQRGQGLVEYALILALVGIVVIAVLIMLGPSIGNVFGRVNNSVSKTGSGSAATVSAPATSIPPTTNLANGSVCKEDDQCNSDKCKKKICVGGKNSACTSNNQCDSNRCVNNKCKEN